MLFASLMIGITVYFIIYVLLTTYYDDQAKVVRLMVGLNICNDIIILSALVLYSYTIVILRRAIAKCSSYQFETRGTYVITGLYIFMLIIGIMWLITYEFLSFSIVVEQLAHKVVAFLIVCIIYRTLL